MTSPTGSEAAQPTSWLASVKSYASDLRDNGTRVPLLLAKPRLFRLWLATARRAQVALGAVLLLLTFVAPPALDAVVTRLYPPVVGHQGALQKAFGHAQEAPNPLHDERYGELTVLSWLVGLAVVVALMLEHVPTAIAIGGQRAAALRKEAARLAANDPEKSVRFTRDAEELLLEDAPETCAPTEVEAVPPERTAVMPASEGPRVQSHLGPGGRYRLEAALGSGGMGVVHAGHDTLLKRPVAVKQLFAHLVQDRALTDRFRQEAVALASMAHPHIVTIYDLLEEAGHFWIVMELLTGGTLAAQIAGGRTKGVRETIAITRDVADGLHYAHQRGIIHRDVKPMNILFNAEGIPKLTDFGNAKLDESIVHTQEGTTLGSPAYMSPEQITGATVDHRTDIYSLGVSVYQMLTAKAPFEGDMRAILAQHVSQPPRRPSELNPAVPPDLETVVLTMLSKAPAERFQSCADVIAALRGVRDAAA